MPLRDKALSIPTVPPSVTDPGLRKQLESMRNALIFLTGQMGNLPKSAVLYEDLEDLDLISLQTTSTGSGVATATPPESSSTADLSVPPAPSGLIATASINNIILEFGGFTIPTDNVAFTEIYRNTVNDRATATLAGVTYGYTYIDSTIFDTNTYYYWVRNVSVANVASNYNALSGTAISLEETPISVVDQLVKEVSAQQTGGGVEILKMNAGLFAIQNATGTGVEYPFIIGNVGGVTKIALDGLAFIPDANITNAKIANLAVTNAKIADLAVEEGKIDNLTITAAVIGDGEIKTANIATAAVTTAKLADQAVTFSAFIERPNRNITYDMLPTIPAGTECGGPAWNFSKQSGIGDLPAYSSKGVYAIDTLLSNGKYAGGWFELFNIPYYVTDAVGNLIIDYRGAVPPLVNLFLPIAYSSYNGNIQIELQVLQGTSVVYTYTFTPLQHYMPANSFGAGGVGTFLTPRSWNELPNYTSTALSPYFSSGFTPFPELIIVPSPIVATEAQGTVSVRYRFVFPVSVPMANTSIWSSIISMETTTWIGYKMKYVHVYQGKK